MNLKSKLSFPLVLRVLIGFQIFAGVLMIIFYNAWLGLLLFGNAALIHLGLEALKGLSSLRELLTYSLFKQGNTPESKVEHDAEPKTPYPASRAATFSHSD